MVATKLCIGCNESKSLTDFYRHRDAHQSRCKPCQDATNRAWYTANKERRRESMAKWERANREARTARHRVYVAKNRDKVRTRNNETQMARRVANPAKFREDRRQRDRIHPETPRRYNSLRRARKKSAGIFRITANELRRLMSNPCYICGGPAQHVDHIIPLSRGGRHSIGNLAPACQTCNHQKHTKFLVEFKARSIG